MEEMQREKEKQSRKVKKEQSRERFVTAMRHDATVEEEEGRERC